MASDTSWKTTSTKRKARLATPAPRKLQRLNSTAKSSSRRASQKTLTQAQWLTPQQNQLADDEMLLDENVRPYTFPEVRGRRRLKKRDSTLTQMDFFDSRSLDLEEQEDMDGQLLPPPSDGSGDNIQSLPQFDGPYSSPRRPRPRKSSTDERRVVPAKQSAESQEYKPSRRKRKLQQMENETPSTATRTSRRVVSKQVVFEDPAQSLEYFNEALAGSTRVTPEKPELEIKESLQEEDRDERMKFEVATPAFQSSLQHLHTPTTKRVIILSSQSPESLPPSVRRRGRHDPSTPDAARRTPLIERSINACQATPSRSSSKKVTLKYKTSPPSQPPSPARKIIVLKLAKRRGYRSVPRIEDSQKNLWSIPSSSSQQQAHSSMLSMKELVPQTREDLSETEIPATSQGHNVTSSPPREPMPESLPSVTDIVERRQCFDFNIISQRDNDAVPQASLQKGTTGADARTVPTEITTPKLTRLDEPQLEPSLPDSGMLLDAPKTLERLMVEDSEAEDSDIESVDSAVRVMASKPLHDGSSTPMPQRNERSEGQERTVSPSPVRGTVNDQASPEKHTKQPMDEPRTPLPLPQLVAQSTTERRPTQPSLRHDADEVQLPRPRFIHRSSTHVSSTLVPLNDIEMAPPSSSQPSTKSMTQKSVNPASMPHPSQVSTQDATQAFLHLSSFPRPFHDNYYEERNDKITIKDSSSCGVSMSQLPQHMDATQSQLNINLGLDEMFNSDEDGDIDLDPPSTASHDKHRLSSDIQIERTPPTKRTVDVLHPDLSRTSAMRKTDDNIEDSPQLGRQAPDQTRNDSPIPSSQQSISIPSSPNPPPLQKKYDPLPGFDNDTQSNFTQGGHVTAAYVHRQREAGVLPDWFTPDPYKVPGYTRRK